MSQAYSCNIRERLKKLVTQICDRMFQFFHFIILQNRTANHQVCVKEPKYLKICDQQYIWNGFFCKSSIQKQKRKIILERECFTLFVLTSLQSNTQLGENKVNNCLKKIRTNTTGVNFQNISRDSTTILQQCSCRVQSMLARGSNSQNPKAHTQ